MTWEGPAIDGAARVAAELIPKFFGNSNQKKYIRFLNNRAHQTQWDQFNAEHQRARENDLVARAQFDKIYGFTVADTERKFQQQVMENTRGYNRAVQEFDLNRSDRHSEFNRQMSWSREQYDRAESERARRIQDTVADATKAGIHPLFALGSSTGYQGGGSLPSSGSAVSGGSATAGYGSNGLPSPQSPGGTIPSSVAEAGVGAVAHGSNRVQHISNAIKALAGIGQLQREEAAGALQAARVEQEIKESNHRMKMSEVEAQIQASQMALATQRLNQTGEGRSARVERTKSKPQSRKEELTDKRTVKDSFGRKHDVLTGPWGIKFRFPQDVDVGETGETFAGEAGALMLGIGGAAEGLVSTGVDNANKLRKMYGEFLKLVPKVFGIK